MRRGEILSLTWENVHLDKRYVHLPDTKNGDSRNVPLSPAALELLRERPEQINVSSKPITKHLRTLGAGLVTGLASMIDGLMT